MAGLAMMPGNMNVLDAVARQVRAYPDRPALHARGQTLSFRRLWQASGLVAHNLRSRGVKRGDGVALAHTPPHIHFIAILAIARMGAFSVSIPPSLPGQARAGMARRLGLRWWLHGEADATGEIEGVTRIAEADVLAPVPDRTRAIGVEQGLADEVWRITFSSGTTGSRKSIAWTHAQRAALEQNMLESFPGGPGECLLVCADLGIGLGLGQALTQLASGGAVALPDNASAQACVDALNKVRPTRLLMTTALAATLVRHLEDSSAPVRPFPGLISILIGGSAPSEALLRDLESRVTPSVQVTYGSTELGSTARSSPASRLVQPASAGRLVPWVEGQAVGEDGQPLPAGQQGLLRFRGRDGGMASGYLGDEAATGQAFRGGWFYPGDTGSVDALGYLVLGARTDDIINIGGRKFDPVAIEQQLNAQAGVIESVVVGVERRRGGSMLVAAVVTEAGTNLEALKSGLTGDGEALRAIVGVDAFPRNDNGKVMRPVLAQQLARALAARRPNP